MNPNSGLSELSNSQRKRLAAKAFNANTPTSRMLKCPKCRGEFTATPELGEYERTGRVIVCPKCGSRIHFTRWVK